MIQNVAEEEMKMKTDIQIAQEAQMEHIKNVAMRAGIAEEELEFYGKYKAKLSDELWERIKDRENGKLVLVTAINPTPAGEGKTTTTVGLGQAMAKLGKNALIALREPSLGPCFGIKGGAAGGGYAQVVPMEDLNLLFPGTSMRSPLQIIFSRRCWTITSSRGTVSGSIPDRLCGNAVLI